MVEEKFVGSKVRLSELGTGWSSRDDPVGIKEDVTTSKPSNSSSFKPF